MPKKSYKNLNLHLEYEEAELGLADAAGQQQVDQDEVVSSEDEYQQHLELMCKDISAAKIQKAFRQHLNKGVSVQIAETSKEAFCTQSEKESIATYWRKLDAAVSGAAADWKERMLLEQIARPLELKSEYEFRCAYVPTKRVTSHLTIYNDHTPPQRLFFQKTKQPKSHQKTADLNLQCEEIALGFADAAEEISADREETDRHEFVI